MISSLLFRLKWALAVPLLALGACQSGSNSSTETETQAAAGAAPPAAAFTVKHPAWASTATIYQVNVRQFSPEGTFRAVEPHLPRLQKMGVGILWLMPINPIGVSHRKGTLGSAYSVRDYRAVNPDLGTLADLQHLVKEAHRLGMHVILDWVANHSSLGQRPHHRAPGLVHPRQPGPFPPARGRLAGRHRPRLYQARPTPVHDRKHGLLG
ncbi:alpha-amylase family glycosyl hydrolase [Hymenobacter humi]|uniref:Alpha-amylase family glycosyl hydrolase n=1 Tax=Hymenobacter humi TaxID=1411620 RepID=A0ABW2U6L8_9BACT